MLRPGTRFLEAFAGAGSSVGKSLGGTLCCENCSEEAAWTGQLPWNWGLHFARMGQCFQTPGFLQDSLFLLHAVQTKPDGLLCGP